MRTMVEITKRSTARRLQALAMRRDGKLFREIGEHFGVTLETARGMVKAGENIEKRRNLRRTLGESE